MQFYTENQTDFDFKFNDPSVLTPEYMPPAEVVTPYHVNKSVLTNFSKKGKLAKFFSLPKISTFVLESLEKSNEFSHEIHSLVKSTQTSNSETRNRVDKLNDRFSALEGRIHLMTGELGDFQHKVQPILDKLSMSEGVIDQKIRKLEENGQELKILKQQIISLKKKDTLLWLVLTLSIGINAGTIFYILR